MVVSPASITHITDFDLNIVSNFRASLCLFLSLLIFLGALFSSSWPFQQIVKLVVSKFLTFSSLAGCINSFWWLFLVFRLLLQLCIDGDVFDFNVLQLLFFIFSSVVGSNHAALACLGLRNVTRSVLALLHLLPFAVQLLFKIFSLLGSHSFERMVLISERCRLWFLFFLRFLLCNCL